MSVRRQSAEYRVANTRDKLLQAAERLYAAEGLEAVSLRRINREAGQLNASALHYHFGTREDLVAAILEKRMGQVNASRLSLIAELRSSGKLNNTFALSQALIYPLAEQVNQGDDTSHYLGFLAAVFSSPEINVYALARDRQDHSLRQLLHLFMDVLPDLPGPLVRMRYSVITRQVIYALADWERDRVIGKMRSRMRFEAFVENLVDMMTAAISARQSERVATPSS